MTFKVADVLSGIFCYFNSLACSYDTSCFNSKLRWSHGWQMCNWVSSGVSSLIMFSMAIIIVMAILLMHKLVKNPSTETETLATKMRKIERYSMDAIFPKLKREPNPSGDAFLESNVRQRKYINDEVEFIVKQHSV